MDPLDSLWDWLRSTAVFRSSFFETGFVTALYAALMLVYLLLPAFPSLNKYRISPLAEDRLLPKYTLRALAAALAEYGPALLA
jgi:hypothetical protein